MKMSKDESKEMMERVRRSKTLISVPGIEVEPVVEKQDHTERYKEEIEEVVDHLNTTAKRRFNPESIQTRKMIVKKLEDGYTVEDMKTVIDIKTREWIGDPKFSKFLRPQTLFGDKFEAYLNESTGCDSEYRRVRSLINIELEGKGIEFLKNVLQDIYNIEYSENID